MSKKIAVLIPCYNEAITIKQVVEDFKKHLPKADIYVYDNNSTDDTVKIAKEAGAIVRKETTQGKAAVVLRMFRDIDADQYLLIDGDDTYPIEEVQALFETMEETNADMVVGDRLSNRTYHEENKRPFHNFGNELIRKLINRFFHTSLKDILSGYRLFNYRFVKNYTTLVKGFELETDLSIFCLNYDMKIAETPVTYRDRPEGSESKLNTFSDGFKVIRLFINLYRLYKPFNFFTIISSSFLLAGIIVGIFPIIDYIESQYVYKVPLAILAVSLVTIAVLLFTCGLILDNISKFDKKNFQHSILNFDESSKHKKN